MLNKDFKEFVKLLNSRKVEYLIVGGYALAAHGHPRYTGDIDIWFSSSPADVLLMLDVLREIGFGAVDITAADLSAPNAVAQLGYPPARIDLLSSIDGVSFDDCHERRIVMQTDGIDPPVIGLNDFRTNKLATGRLKDLADIEALDEGSSKS